MKMENYATGLVVMQYCCGLNAILFKKNIKNIIINMILDNTNTFYKHSINICREYSYNVLEDIL